MREILLEMYEKLWNADKDKYGVEWMANYPYYPFKFRTKTNDK